MVFNSKGSFSPSFMCSGFGTFNVLTASGNIMESEGHAVRVGSVVVVGVPVVVGVQRVSGITTVH